MKYTTVFHLIGKLTKNEHISCVLIGGFAINYYKVTRQTLDVDFLITKTDFERIENLLNQEGYKKDFIEKVFIRLKNSGKQLNLMDINFMFVEKETLDKIIQEGKEIVIGGQKFFIPSLSHLIALKLHSIKYNPHLRELKDLPDIVNLIRMNNINTKDKKFKELCLKYGTEDLYQKILNYF
ncbi:MAG: nucleotidyltransferase [Elusimicrobia bacterium]|nr:nucleotidyltransferase [Elusimicrobiota bacterium]